MTLSRASLAALLLATPAVAQIDVALVAAASTSNTDCRFTGPQSFLLATGQFSSVDIINAGSVTPSVAELQAYDAIVTWTNFDYANEIALGDNLADYVDAGGGVVVATFANSSTSSARQIGGRWTTGYQGLSYGSGTTTGSALLGNVLVPAHPILQSVVSFDGGSSSFRPSAAVLTTGSTLVAEWDDGRPLVVEGPVSGVVELGFYPPSNNCSSTFWNAATDGDLLLANALTFAANGGGGLGMNYCTSTANSTGSPAMISANGTASVAANQLNLEASPVPNQPGLFFYGPDQILLPFGNGFRCVGGVVGRLDIVPAAGNVLSYSVDNTQPPNAQTVITAGSVWNFQAWFRDPLGGGASFNLSDGVEIAFVP